MSNSSAGTSKRGWGFREWFAAFWVTFTVALAVWWLIFGLRQLALIQSMQHDAAATLGRQQTMLLTEGSILILSVVVGGFVIFRSLLAERDKHRQIQDFFTAFSHDIKTSLASLRLQVESLKEDMESQGTARNPLMDRLIQDSVRLQLQLENSLFFANLENAKLHLEPIALSRVVEKMRLHWPHMKIQLVDDVRVKADARAIETVLGNLIQNSIVHGQASDIEVTAKITGSRVEIRVQDNGTGFTGELEKLGTLFERPATSSGTGIGLYLIIRLMNQMHGSVRFEKGVHRGFSAYLDLEAA